MARERTKKQRMPRKPVDLSGLSRMEFADFGPGNHENGLQEVLDGQASSGCVYSDMESARQHLKLQLVSTTTPPRHCEFCLASDPLKMPTTFVTQSLGALSPSRQN